MSRDCKGIDERLHDLVSAMVEGKGILILFCGKMAAGKSTLSRRLAVESGAVLISEDEWLGALYPEEIRDLKDYVRYSSRLKLVLKPHVQGLLKGGRSVVMDFPGNTKRQRAWLRELFSEHDLPHRLIYLQADDQVCLRQLSRRRQLHPERSHMDTEELFHRVTGFFEPPEDDEGFNIQVIAVSDSED